MANDNIYRTTLRAAGTGGWLRALTAAADRLVEWRQRARERHQLASLGDQVLRDLGVSRSDVEREVAKPFWRK